MCTRGEQQEVAIQGDPGVSMKGAPHLGLPDFRVTDFKMWTLNGRHLPRSIRSQW